MKSDYFSVYVSRVVVRMVAVQAIEVVDLFYSAVTDDSLLLGGIFPKKAMILVLFDRIGYFVY